MFGRFYRILDANTHEQLFRGQGVCAQEVYDEYKRGTSKPPGYDKELDAKDPAVRAAAFKRLRTSDEWINDESVFMVVEEIKR